MRIGIGNDHTAVELKDIITEHLTAAGFEVVDFGAKAGERCDYPVPGRDVAEAIVSAAVCSEPYSAKMAALHNNAQIIAFGARVVGSEMAKMIVDSFFETEFEGGRHQNRLDIISEIEEKYSR